MIATEDETSTHDVAARTTAKDGPPPEKTAAAGEASTREKNVPDAAVADDKPHQIKPDGR